VARRSGDVTSIIEECEVELLEEARLEREGVLEKDVSPTKTAAQESPKS